MLKNYICTYMNDFGLNGTSFDFPNQTGKYTGKVREVYEFGNKIAMIATDRISAFDAILPKPIPYKGQVLNQIAAKFLDATKDIVPNWLEETPHPNVSFGKKCEPIRVEMVIRGYLTGHAWREYRSGKTHVCGVAIPEGMKENQKFDTPIITPTTKAIEGKDEDISKEDILKKGLVSKEDYEVLEKYTHQLFERGTQIAKQKGLILVDTKYEFGKYDGKTYLIDEVHTPDSSRYFYADSYQTALDNNESPKQLSKEFVRQWLIENGFQGKEGQQIPEMTNKKIEQISNRYIELFEKITGDAFIKDEYHNKLDAIQSSILNFIR